VHLDLYVTGYRTIPTIGDLFLLQVISALGLAVAILVARWRITAAAGAGFLLATLGGYLVSLHTPLFGFREVRTTAGVVAGVIEVVGFAVLAALALRPSERGSLTPSRRALPFAGACWAAGALFVFAAVSLGLSLNSTLPGVSSAGGSGARLDATTIGGVSVLTDSSGFTLYWFGPDTPTTSACTGSCLAYWHPLAGTPTEGAGVRGSLGTIRRADGTLQATYDAHPLYTYIGDASPGDAHGNNLDLNGGTWHEVIASGSA
jgi:predicted lipoprotein with Yx(FWY)xxD motif